MKTNIALIGMMGTFKSTCGKILADAVELLFLDTDALIEYEECRSIQELFDEFGEEYFRDIESKKISRISSYENIIIATGGGVVKREQNMRLLQKSSYIVLLTATSQAIFERVKKSKHRPLLKKMKLATINQLQEERKDLYQKYADITVDTTSKTPFEVVDSIREQLYRFVCKEKNGGKQQ